MTTKSVLILLLRLGMSAGLLVFLFVWVEIDFDTLWPDDAVAVAWLVAALFCVIGSVVLAALRWKQVCEALDCRYLRGGWCGTTSLASSFRTSFLPRLAATWCG